MWACLDSLYGERMILLNYLVHTRRSSCVMCPADCISVRLQGMATAGIVLLWLGPYSRADLSEFGD